MDHIENVQDAIDCGCDDCVQARARFDAWVEDTHKRWHNPICGPLCAEHGDPRDTSIDVVRLRCYFGCGRTATTTRTRPDGAVKNCPTCADCADLIDEQNYYERQAYEQDPERVRS